MTRALALALVFFVSCSKEQDQRFGHWLDEGATKETPTPAPLSETARIAGQPGVRAGFLDSCIQGVIDTYMLMSCSVPPAARGVLLYCDCQYNFVANDGNAADLEICARASGLALFTKGTCS